MKKIILGLLVAVFLVVGAYQVYASPLEETITRTLKEGMKGSDISYLQTYLGVPADGYYGPQTVSKVKSWQTLNNLASDGIFGPGSLLKLKSLKNTGSVLGEMTDTTPRIMYWSGKVNQHVDSSGVWQTDPDGSSGADLDKLTYCKKFWPNTTSVEAYKAETIDTWRAAGNTGAYSTSKISDKCVQPAEPLSQCTITSFNVPSTLVKGQSTTISWNTSNCGELGLEFAMVTPPGVPSGGSGGRVAGPSGSMSVSPTSTTKYTLFASSLDGRNEIKSEKTMTVTDVATTCTISSFTASSSKIVKGQSVKLSWDTSNCGELSILSLGSVTGPSGSVEVYPTTNIGYVLIAMAKDGRSAINSEAKNVIVTNETTPSITVTSPNGGETYSAGQQITVKWKSENFSSSYNVAIQLMDDVSKIDYKDNGRQLFTINDGEAAFTIPLDDWDGTKLIGGKRYKIGIWSGMNEGYPNPSADWSDNTFTINNITNPICSIDAGVVKTYFGDEKNSTWGFYVKVTNPNSSKGWTTNFEGYTPVVTAYGTTKLFGNFNINSGPLKFTAKDTVDSNCSYTITVYPPSVTLDTTPRIMYWYGKVNQHVDANGKWQTDTDGRSGADLDKLTYCKKFWPNTTSVQSYKTETIDTWRAAGNTGAYSTAKVSDKCVQGTNLTPSITVLSPNGGEIYYLGSVSGDSIFKMESEINSSKIGNTKTFLVSNPSVNNPGKKIFMGGSGGFKPWLKKIDWKSTYLIKNGLIEPGQYYLMETWKSEDGLEDLVDFSDNSFTITSSDVVINPNYCSTGLLTQKLWRGTSGSHVKTLQSILVSLDYLDDKDVDGKFGRGTRSAVIAFQSANNLTPDGYVGTGTMNALNKQWQAKCSEVNTININDTELALSVSQCLKEKGAVLYSTSWCPWCNKQKELFGSYFKNITNIDCMSSVGSEQSAICNKENITGYPTWKFKDGSVLSGLQSLESLSSKAGCPSSTSTSQSISLKAGWNILSFNVKPTDLSLNSMFASMNPSNGETIVNEDDVRATYTNGSWTGGLSSIDILEGYKVNVSKDKILTVSGTPISIDTIIPLKNGTNLVPYYPTVEINAVDALSSIGSCLKKVMDEVGNTYEDRGAFGGWTNKIGTLKPGEGYRIITTCSANLNYNSR